MNNFAHGDHAQPAEVAVHSVPLAIALLVVCVLVVATVVYVVNKNRSK